MAHLGARLTGFWVMLPSQGPSAYVQAESPAHPNTRFYNTVAGHLISIIAGVIGVALF